MGCNPPGFSVHGREYGSGLPFPSPEDLPNPGIKPESPVLRADSLLSEPQGKPMFPCYSLHLLSTYCVLRTLPGTGCSSEWTRQTKILALPSAYIPTPASTLFPAVFQIFPNSVLGSLTSSLLSSFTHSCFSYSVLYFSRKTLTEGVTSSLSTRAGMSLRHCLNLRFSI